MRLDQLVEVEIVVDLVLPAKALLCKTERAYGGSKKSNFI